MSPLAVAWDVDGTLIDSEPIHLRALLRVAADAGADLSEWSDEAFVGVALPDVWTAVASRFPALDAAGFFARVNAAYARELADTPPGSAARDALSTVAARGLPQAIVSNSHRAVVAANLDALGVRSLLSAVITLEEAPRPKPDPAPYLLAAERLGVAPERLAAVEDSATGVASALAAGCRTIALAPVAPPQPRLTVVRSLAEAVAALLAPDAP